MSRRTMPCVYKQPYGEIEHPYGRWVLGLNIISVTC